MSKAQSVEANPREVQTLLEARGPKKGERNRHAPKKSTRVCSCTHSRIGRMAQSQTLGNVQGTKTVPSSCGGGHQQEGRARCQRRTDPSRVGLTGYGSRRMCERQVPRRCRSRVEWRDTAQRVRRRVRDRRRRAQQDGHRRVGGRSMSERAETDGQEHDMPCEHVQDHKGEKISKNRRSSSQLCFNSKSREGELTSV